MAKKNNLSIIDDGFSIEGSIEFSGELLIRGRLSGNIKGDTVTIAEEGVAKADMAIRRLTIGGRFEGEVRASEELVILPSGSCAGKVLCKNLVVKEGGALNADVSHLEGSSHIQEKRLTGPAKDVIKL